jgi:hypothetical protein
MKIPKILCKLVASLVLVIGFLFILPYVVQTVMTDIHQYWAFLCIVFNDGEQGVNGGIHGWPLATFIVWAVASVIVVTTGMYCIWYWPTHGVTSESKDETAPLLGV